MEPRLNSDGGGGGGCLIACLRVCCRAALRLVWARVLCQMQAPYSPIIAHKNFPLPPIAGNKTAGAGAAAPLAPALMLHWYAVTVIVVLLLVCRKEHLA